MSHLFLRRHWETEYAHTTLARNEGAWSLKKMCELYLADHFGKHGPGLKYWSWDHVKWLKDEFVEAARESRQTGSEDKCPA